MILEVISSKEFDRYAVKHPLNSFYQSSMWGILKEKNGWKKHFLALKDEKTVGATLLLEKKTVLGSIYYAPRGFLVDYQNEELLTTMVNEVKSYVKAHNGILLKIDPYYEYLQRDIDGNIVTDGYNNESVIRKLKELGFTNVYEEHTSGGLQPNWLFVLDLEGKTEEDILKNMNGKTRNIIRKVEKTGFEVKPLDKKELEIYKKIMEHTSKRRGFIDRPLSYYQDMYNALGDNIKILLARLDVKKYICNLKEQAKENDNHITLLEKEMKERNCSKKKQNELKVCEELKAELTKKLEDANKLKEEHGEVIDMASSMFIMYGDEVVYLFSGAYDEFMRFDAQYILQWEMIKYSIKNGYKRYNFYGISNKFTKDDPMYGIYTFKKGFDGRVVELIGEYDLVIRKFKYFLYKMALKAYRLTKR